MRILYHIFHIPYSGEITYLPDRKIIIDEKGREIFWIKNREVRPYFYFELKFYQFEYNNYQQLSSKSLFYQSEPVREKIITKIYHFYLILRQLSVPPLVGRIIHNYLAYYQIQMIKNKTESKKRNYKKFIKERERERLKLTNWGQIELTGDSFYDLRERMIIRQNQATQYIFSYYGGIIQTTDIKRVIKYFRNSKNFIMLPKSMKSLWRDQTCLFYDDFDSLCIESLSGEWERIIIHECYQDLLPRIKKIVKRLTCDNIWILNSFPLSYYFIEDRIKMPQMISFLNLWMQLSLPQKNRLKIEIMKFTSLYWNRHYLVAEFHHHYQSHHLPLTSYDKGLVQFVQKSYRSFITPLEIDISQKILQKWQRQFYMIFLILCLSVTHPLHISANLQRMRERKKEEWREDQTRLYRLITYLKISKKEFPSENYQDEHFHQFLKPFYEKYRILEKKICHYDRYQSYDLTNCPICDGEDKKVILICGHTICLKCLLSLLEKRECPLCREEFRLQQILSICNKKSSLQNFLDRLSSYSLLLTDFNIEIHNTDKFSFINLSATDFFSKIKKLQRVEEIFIITLHLGERGDRYSKMIHAVTQYLLLLNNMTTVKVLTLWNTER